MKKKFEWPDWATLALALFLMLGSTGCKDGLMPGSSSNSTITNNTYATTILMNYVINGSGSGVENEYLKMAITQKDNLKFLIEWEPQGVFAGFNPYQTYDFYVDSEVAVDGIEGEMLLWTAPNESESYIFKICIAGMSAAFCSDGALVEITAIEEPPE